LVYSTSLKNIIAIVRKYCCPYVNLRTILVLHSSTFKEKIYCANKSFFRKIIVFQFCRSILFNIMLPPKSKKNTHSRLIKDHKTHDIKSNVKCEL